ncbi:MAG: hypothetical protein HYW49_07675 [Deltaproteobacteria bacterium]|nr:hypothetical protein [Deltaproteobacteria bacterium]
MDRSAANFSRWIRVLAFAAVTAIVASVQLSRAVADSGLPITETEYRALATELAPKVNLFAEIWKQDPNVEFYGGTSRDFLYWILRQFRGVKTRSKAESVMARLRRAPLIDVREFILQDSDVDVIAKEGSLNVSASQFGVRKIDVVSPDILDPNTVLGRGELDQGYVPAEKIRLTKQGIKTHPGFVDGVSEIISGNLTIRFAPEEKFWKTKYAREGLNHPVLLALRYLRVVSTDYYQRFGVTYPVEVALDPRSDAAVRAVVDSVRDGRALRPFFERPQFVTWFNASIQKAFRSYANPTVAFHLMKRFGIDQLITLYPKIEPFFNYLLVRKWDERKIAANFAKSGLSPEEVYTDPRSYFPDLTLYHGTRTEAGFRSIVLQGIIASEDGSTGKGLYGVSKGHISFAESWGGSPDRVVAIRMNENTKLIDTTTGTGKKLFKSYKGDYESFAEAFGADLIRYEYGDVEAFILKNSGAIAKIEGHIRKVLPLSKFIESVEAVRTLEDLKRLLPSFLLYQWSRPELQMLSKTLPEPKLLAYEIARAIDQGQADFLWRDGPSSAFVETFYLPIALEDESSGLLKALFSAGAMEAFWSGPKILLENLDWLKKPNAEIFVKMLADNRNRDLKLKHEYNRYVYYVTLMRILEHPDAKPWREKIVRSGLNDQEIFQLLLAKPTSTDLHWYLLQLESGPSLLVRLILRAESGDEKLKPALRHFFGDWYKYTAWHDERFFPILLFYFETLDAEELFDLISMGPREIFSSFAFPQTGRFVRLRDFFWKGKGSTVSFWRQFKENRSGNPRYVWEMKPIDQIRLKLRTEFGEPDLSAFGLPPPKQSAPKSGSTGFIPFCARMLRAMR